VPELSLDSREGLAANEACDGRGEAYFVTLPDVTSSFEVVAGARYEPVQKNLEPAERFVVGGRGLRWVA